MKKLLFASMGLAVFTIILFVTVLWQGHEIERLEKSQLDGVGVLIQVLKIPEISRFSVSKAEWRHGTKWMCTIDFKLFELGNLVFGHGESPAGAINDALRIYEKKRKEFCK